MENAIERLAGAIGYPDTAGGAGNGSFTFRADGHAIEARERAGRLVLKCIVTPAQPDPDAGGATATLAAYATGRMLKEEATLAWGENGLFLWADAPSDASGRDLAAFFEGFAASCDWWRERADELQAEPSQGGADVAETIIRP